MRWFVAAFILLAAAQAAAQPPSSGQSAVPPELLVPSEEARIFFEVLQSRPLSDETMERIIQAMPGGSARPMDDVIERVLAPGPAVPDWQQLGIDERAAIEAHEGGLAANMTEGATQYGPAYGYYMDRSIETLIPPEWVLIGRRGAPVSGESVEIGVSHLSPKLILVERIAFRHLGNAGCRTQAESRLYADPSVPASQADMIATVFTMRFLSVLERRSLCQVVEEVGQGQYRARFFDTEGHSLAAFDADQTRFRIVPFRPVPRPAAPR